MGNLSKGLLAPPLQHGSSSVTTEAGSSEQTLWVTTPCQTSGLYCNRSGVPPQMEPVLQCLEAHGEGSSQTLTTVMATPLSTVLGACLIPLELTVLGECSLFPSPPNHLTKEASTRKP